VSNARTQNMIKEFLPRYAWIDTFTRKLLVYLHILVSYPSIANIGFLVFNGSVSH